MPARRPASPVPGRTGRHRRRSTAALAALAVAVSGLVAAPAAHAEDTSTISPFDAVDPYIGTGYDRENNARGNDHYGNTFPGATVPFGMVQSSPTTYNSVLDEQFGGYEHSADQLRGFGMTRLSGTGCRPRYSGNDFPVLPVTQRLVDGALPSNPSTSVRDYFLDFSHDDEVAEPGYYSVALDSGVDVELTSTTRTAVSRYSFDDGTPATLVFDAAGSNNDVSASRIDVDPATGRVTGTVTSKIVCASGPEYTAHFSATFDQPVESYGTWDGDSVDADGTSASATTQKHGSGAWVTFADGADVTVTAGLSYVSVDGAQANAEAETTGATFDDVRATARASWEQALGTVAADGGTERDRVTFYTALYHALGHPNVFQDADGRYTGYDGEVRTVRDGHDFYVNLSGWDTYRGQSQLVALLYPDVASDINQSILDMVDQSGGWSSWPSLNRIQTKMSGDSLQIILAAADAFGATDYDREGALRSMVETQSLPATGSLRSDAFQYSALGFVDGDKRAAAVTRNLEYAADDFAIAQLAGRLGDTGAYDLFSQRSQSWLNSFNFTTKHIDARNRNGFMNVPLNRQGDHFEQSTGKQYGFNVSHNMAGLIEARGGVEKATADLDALLADLDGGAFSETAYLANQPSFGLPWVYNWLQAPHRTTDTLYRAADELFTTAPTGLAGNDDLGSMSAWYVWANLGIMPGIWGTADLLVSAPMFEHVTISSVGSDRVIQIDAPGAGDTARYTTGLSVDGTPQTASWLPGSFAQGGGTLSFTMASTPGTWGTAPGDVPPSYQDGTHARNGHGVTDDGAVNMGSLDVGGVTLSRQDLEAAGVTGGGEVPLGKTGVTFMWPDTEPGEADHWIPNGQVVDLGDEAASGISFLGLATNGPSRGTAVVSYTDGSTQDVDVRFSDWVPGSLEPGNVRLVELTKRNTASGGSDAAKPVVFATAVVPLDPDKQVTSVRLPRATTKGIMHIFDVALRPVVDAEPGDPDQPALPTRPAPQEPTAPEVPASNPVDGAVLLDGTSTWSYLDDGTDPAEGLAERTAWTLPGVDVSAWKTGTGGFGAKNGVLGDLGGGFTPTTLLQQKKDGGTSGDNIETYFFRTTFTVAEGDLAQISQLTGSIAYDDAARVYVNGILVGGFADERIDEIPSGNLGYAGGNGSAPITGGFTVPADVLVAGENVVAVQVHNTNAGSSDVYLEVPSLTVVAAASAATYSDVSLHVGADETQRNLAFYTDREITGQVQVAPVSARTGDAFPVEAATVVDATSEPTQDGRYSNKAVMAGLAENTSYLYRVGSDASGWSRSYELWTGTFDETHSFVFTGDPQIGASGNQQRDRESWAAVTEQVAALEPDASMWLNAGDQVERHRDEFEYESLFAPAIMQQLPFVSTIGNHDNQGQAYMTHFNRPNVSEVHGYESTPDRAGGDYWFEYNGVLYLNINSNAHELGDEDHIEFMREVIEEHGGDASWVVAVWHHSIYSAAFHSLEQDVVERRAALAPAMSELGVDLVLSGHDHIYTRSYLMDGTTAVGDKAAQEESGAVLTAEEGQVLYVTGNSSSGSKYYALDDRSPDAAIKIQARQPQYTDVDVSPTAITLTTTQVFDGTVIDQVTLTRAGGGDGGADTTAPEIGVPDEDEVPQGQPFDPLAGVTATDDVDGDLTASVTVEGTVDTTTPGDTVLTYAVSDAAGNRTTVERTVTVVAVAPTFGGVQPSRNVVVGTVVDPLVGVTALDANGVDLTDRITVSLDGANLADGAVDTGTPGVRTLTYEVTDDHGTVGTAETVLTVRAEDDPEPVPSESQDPGDGSGQGTGGGAGGTAGPDGAGAADGAPGRGGFLAVTGATIWGTVLLSLLLVGAGTVLVIRRRSTDG
ncbi:GH92 family glycosyl hydrolase [Sanguibacter suaedae]|uniref:GH92 family glycosyl hydrolase n=1 Tax=Sanguibacter suaedae TaxID=2795737 RepID=A0A934I3X2_9MICO|nr:GH92 family glycosyl hydrolase [Sanguibacter suaedae]MBI9115129.1 GH92 family glycosyl hydrolase [Sanguibacter suaedae]